MQQYNILDTKNILSRISKTNINKKKDNTIVVSNSVKRKPGTLKNLFKYDDRFADDNEEITKMFENI